MHTFSLIQKLFVCTIVLAVGRWAQESDEILTATVDSGVQDIILPMCRNFLDYNQTRLPNQFGHSTQVEIYRLVDEGEKLYAKRSICAVYQNLRWMLPSK